MRKWRQLLLLLADADRRSLSGRHVAWEIYELSRDDPRPTMACVGCPSGYRKWVAKKGTPIDTYT